MNSAGVRTNADTFADLEAFRSTHDHGGAEECFMGWRFVEGDNFAIAMCCVQCKESIRRDVIKDEKSDTMFPDWILKTVLAGTAAGTVH